jgi:hypothetical protein
MDPTRIPRPLFPLRRRYVFQRFPPGLCWALLCVLEPFPPKTSGDKETPEPKKRRRIGFRFRPHAKTQKQ